MQVKFSDHTDMHNCLFIPPRKEVWGRYIRIFNFSITNYSSYLQCSTFLFPMKRKKNTNQLTPNVGNPSEVRNYAHKRLLVLRTRSAAFVYFPAKQSRCQQVRKLILRKKLAFVVLYNMCHR